jgi:hypothetical protein
MLTRGALYKTFQMYWDDMDRCRSGDAYWSLLHVTAKFVLRLHGIGRPPTRPMLRMVPEAVALTSEPKEGPAFDRFGGRVRR